MMTVTSPTATGDNSNMDGWLTLLIVSALALGTGVVLRRKKKSV